jgi:hypothetical protein
MAMLPSAPGRYSELNFTPVCRSTIDATILNDISFPAPGPLGNITVTGRVGCQAQAVMGNKAATMNFFNMVDSPLNTV